MLPHFGISPQKHERDWKWRGPSFLPAGAALSNIYSSAISFSVFHTPQEAYKKRQENCMLQVKNPRLALVRSLCRDSTLTPKIICRMKQEYFHTPRLWSTDCWKGKSTPAIVPGTLHGNVSLPGIQGMTEKKDGGELWERGHFTPISSSKKNCNTWM